VLAVPRLGDQSFAGDPLAGVLNECPQNLERLGTQLHRDAVPQQPAARRIDEERSEFELFRCDRHLSGSPDSFTVYIELVKKYQQGECRGVGSIMNAYGIVRKVIFGECKLFRDVAHARSLSRAAAMNGISQSAATQHIQELEKRLGVQLLDRSTRPLGVTPGGKLYAELCRDVLRREEDFAVALDEIKAEAEGTVRVASIYSIGLSDMPRLREEFLRACPGAQLHIEYLRPDKVYEAVLQGQADLGFISYPEHRRGLTVIPWRDERMTVAVYPSHPLAAFEILLPADLDGQDFIAFDEEVIIRRELDRFFRDHGVSISVVMQFDNIQSIKEAVVLGSGISILPERTMQAEVEQNRLVSIPLHAPELVRPTGIIHRRKKKLTRAGREFMNLVVATEGATTEDTAEPELVGMS